MAAPEGLPFGGPQRCASSGQFDSASELANYRRGSNSCRGLISGDTGAADIQAYRRPDILSARARLFLDGLAVPLPERRPFFAEIPAPTERESVSMQLVPPAPKPWESDFKAYLVRIDQIISL